MYLCKIVIGTIFLFLFAGCALLKIPGKALDTAGKVVTTTGKVITTSGKVVKAGADAVVIAGKVATKAMDSPVAQKAAAQAAGIP